MKTAITLHRSGDKILAKRMGFDFAYVTPTRIDFIEKCDVSIDEGRDLLAASKHFHLIYNSLFTVDIDTSRIKALSVNWAGDHVKHLDRQYTDSAYDDFAAGCDKVIDYLKNIKP